MSPNADSPSSPTKEADTTPKTHRRNRAGSTGGFDLLPYRSLLASLEKEEDLEEGGGGEDAKRKREVKAALRMLLDHVDGLTVRLHSSLAKQLETDHQLTIARSNLVMQEANAEMLEEALRRGGEFSHALIAQTHRRSAPPQITQPQQGLASPVQIGRRSTELPVTQEEVASTGSGGWFSRRSTNKKNGFSPIPPSMSSPPLNSSSPRRSNEVMVSSQFGSSTPNLGLGLGAIASPATSPSQPSFNSPTPTNGEIISLRQSLAQERTQRLALGSKLKALQASKEELEAELENLSQALFEEANKMVADERRVRLEKEEEATEARSERDALRQAVRVVEEDCKALRDIVESLGARVPESSSNAASSSSRDVDLSNSPAASTSSLPPSSPSSTSRRLPPRNRSPSPTPRKQRGPPSALLLSPSLAANNTNIILSPSPSTPSRRIPLGRRNKDSSDTSSIHSTYSTYSSSSVESRGERSPSGRRIPLTPSSQRRVQQLGLGLGVGNEDREREDAAGEGRKRSGTTSSVESLDRLMADMKAEFGDVATPTSASFASSPPPPPAPPSGRFPTSTSQRSFHLSPPSSPQPRSASPRSIPPSSPRMLSARAASPLPGEGTGSPRRVLLMSQSNASGENPWNS